MFNYDCVVIGAGVSGMTAAIYLKRAEVNVALLERNAPGGQINKTSLIENYPGFTGDGPTLAINMFNQVNNLNIPYLYADVKDIVKIENGFEIISDTSKITAKKIIIATGRTPNKLGISLEDELTNRGISWCAICDGPLFQNKKVAVVGSGNSALEESLYLASICEEVIILNRSDKFKGDKYLVEKVESTSNIKVMYNTNIASLIEENDVLAGININNNGVEESIKVAGLFIYIGFKPDINFLANLSLENKNGYIETDKEMRTSMPGIYACGDVINKNFYQISTGVGDGTVAALTAVHDLNKD